MWPLRATPAASTLFDIRDAPKAIYEDVQFFRTFVPKLFYIAQKVKPECLDAVALLTTREHDVDADDMHKFRRLLGYLRAKQNRGIAMRMGDIMEFPYSQTDWQLDRYVYFTCCIIWTSFWTSAISETVTVGYRTVPYRTVRYGRGTVLVY